MKRRGKEGKETKIEIIPMIDTMFFLLVFFLLSSLNIINLESINMTLPKESQKETIPTKVEAQLTVAIHRDGSVYVNTKPVTPEEVGTALIAAATADVQKKGKNRVPDREKMSVVISAQTGVKHGLVVSCIDSARKEEIKRFAIAVDSTLIP